MPQDEDPAMQDSAAQGQSMQDTAMMEGQEESDEPTPEEQQTYEKVVLAGIKVLTDVSDQVLQMLQSGADNPPQSLADTTWTIMSAIDEKSGGNIDVGVLVAAGSEVMQNVGEFANEAGIFQVDEKVLNQGWQIIMQKLSDEYGIDWGAETGEAMQGMDPQELQGIVQQQQGYAA